MSALSGVSADGTDASIVVSAARAVHVPLAGVDRERERGVMDEATVRNAAVCEP